METSKKETVKLCRLWDIVYHHIKKANPKATLGDLEALNQDLVVFMKNFVMTLEALDACVEVKGLYEEAAFK